MNHEALRTLRLEVNEARPVERRLPVGCEASRELLALLVRATELEARGSAAEQVEHARKLREARERCTPPPAVEAQEKRWDLADELEKTSPAEGAWLRSARGRLAQALARKAEERAGQGELPAQVERAGQVERPAQPEPAVQRSAAPARALPAEPRQRSLWGAA